MSYKLLRLNLLWLLSLDLDSWFINKGCYFFIPKCLKSFLTESFCSYLNKTHLFLSDILNEPRYFITLSFGNINFLSISSSTMIDAFFLLNFNRLSWLFNFNFEFNIWLLELNEFKSLVSYISSKFRKDPFSKFFLFFAGSCH